MQFCIAHGSKKGRGWKSHWIYPPSINFWLFTSISAFIIPLSFFGGGFVDQNPGDLYWILRRLFIDLSDWTILRVSQWMGSVTRFKE
jgi:hypothetical protein